MRAWSVTLALVAAGSLAVAVAPARGEFLPKTGRYYGRTSNGLVEMKAQVNRPHAGRMIVSFECHEGSISDSDPGDRRGEVGSNGKGLAMRAGASKATFSYQGRTVDPRVRGTRLDPGTFTLSGKFVRSKPAQAGVHVSAARCFGGRSSSLTIKRCRSAAQCQFRGPPPNTVSQGGEPHADIIAGTDAARTAPRGYPVDFVDESYCGDSSTSHTCLASETWDFGDGTRLGPRPYSEQTVQHTWQSTGTYTVRLTVTDNQGRSDSMTVPITIKECAEYDNPPYVCQSGAGP